MSRRRDKTNPPKPGEIKVSPTGDVVIGAPTAVAVVVVPKEGE